MEVGPGRRMLPSSAAAVSSSRETRRASTTSWPSGRGRSSPGARRARQPSMRERGKGQGWEATYSTSATRSPVSSRTSRATAASTDSPASTKPATTE